MRRCHGVVGKVPVYVIVGKYLGKYQSIYLGKCQSMYLGKCQSMYLRTCQSIYLKKISIDIFRKISIDVFGVVLSPRNIKNPILYSFFHSDVRTWKLLLVWNSEKKLLYFANGNININWNLFLFRQNKHSFYLVGLTILFSKIVFVPHLKGESYQWNNNNYSTIILN